MKEEIKISRKLVKGIIKNITTLQISKDVIECICEILEQELNDLGNELSAKIKEENILREKSGLPKLKRIDINLFNNVSNRLNIAKSRFNFGDAGEHNIDTAFCQTQKKKGVPYV